MRRRRRRHTEGGDRQAGIARQGRSTTAKTGPRTPFGAFFGPNSQFSIQPATNSQSINHTDLKWADRTDRALESPMTPDWNAIRLDLLQIDEPMRATLREMRPFFAKSHAGHPGAVLRQGPAARSLLRHLQGRHDAGGDPPAAASLGPDRRRRFRRRLPELRDPVLRTQSSRRGRAAMVCRLPHDVHLRPADEGRRRRDRGSALRARRAGRPRQEGARC